MPETFITDVGDILAPFAFVMLVDWLWGRMRDKRDPATYFRTPAGFSEHWRAGAILSFFTGFVFSFWGTSIFPAAFYDNVPLALFGSLVAAILYAAYVLVRDRTGHAKPTPVRQAEPAHDSAEHGSTAPWTSP